MLIRIDGNQMLTVPSNARLFLCQTPMNMRKSFEGLGTVIGQLFPGELLSGAFFIFLNRYKDHMKVLFWDGDGFVIWYKRLEKGTFSSKWGSETLLDRRSFLMLLEGITPRRLQSRFSLQK
jgi:transposase